jgi:hypothetical protein
VLAVVLVAALVAVAVLGLRLHTQRDLDAQREPVLRSAERFATELSSIRAETAPKQLDELKAQTTTPIRGQLDQMAAAFQAIAVGGKLEADGRVTSSGLERLTRSDASALVTVSTTVSHQGLPVPEDRHYRMAVTLRRDGEQWLVADAAVVK